MPDPIKPTDGRPEKIGDYVIHRLIGEGGMAQVWEGEEPLSHRRVAVKVLRTELANSDQVRRQFLAEMKILASLDDPNIVRCLACMQHEGRPVMVLERLEGWTLREMLSARRALDWPEMVRYAIQIAKALRAAHSRKPSVVHRDLKPENVIVLPDGRLKVMDFGIAKILQTMTGTTDNAFGTLQYMSPEQIDAKPVDGRADLFALGLLMWEMLVGRPPFQGSSPRMLLEKICSEPTPQLPAHVRSEVPPHIEALINRLLAKNPAERFANANEVIEHLTPWAQPSPPQVAATQVQPMPPPQVAARANQASEEPRKGRFADQAEAIADEINRFAEATSALIVRIMVALLVLPAAAVGFVGVPLTLAAVGVAVLEDDGVDVESFDAPSWLTPGFVALAGLLATVVFIHACWAHRREPGPGLLRTPWLWLGGVLIVSWVATTAIELSPKSSLGPELHVFCIASSFFWLVIMLSWVTGRITSRLFRRLERPAVSE
ncbi:MAG TPA: serine/threonine-protein kinase [Enhygromyxa sp.]|nr:serine/threonine-protein kinase [Enhygromyxa sp.]